MRLCECVAGLFRVGGRIWEGKWVLRSVLSIFIMRVCAESHVSHVYGRSNLA